MAAGWTESDYYNYYYCYYYYLYEHRFCYYYHFYYHYYENRDKYPSAARSRTEARRIRRMVLERGDAWLD